MIPRPVAERLRSGQNTLSTCQNFEEVSVLFAEVEVFSLVSVTFSIKLVTFHWNFNFIG